MKKLSLAAVALALSAGVALAQTPTVPTPQPSAMSKVKDWSSKQWNAAKKEWAKDKAKWDDCQQQSKDQKLSGRKSWSLLYTCMNT